jgi:ribosomal protein S1
MMDDRRNNGGKPSVSGIEEGMVIDGKVRKIVDFGIFVEVAPKKDGLVHISTIARDKQATLLKTVKPGDTLKVKVIAVEPETGRIRLMAPDLK